MFHVEHMHMEIIGKIVDPVMRRIYGAKIIINNGIIEHILPYQGDTNFYIMPGFVDAHVHIESSMLTPQRFSELAIVHGTVAVVSDPHEIANVLGVNGVDFMIENAKLAKIKVFFGAPSCVPATSFETSGAKILASDISKMFEENKVWYLSEMMNYPGVIFNDPEVMEKMAIAKKFNKPIDGHAPALDDESIVKYAAAGITTDHECISLHEALVKIDNGMKILIREGSAAKNFDTLASLIHSNPSDCMFCTDDCHPDNLIDGHINLLFKRALKLGYSVFDILQVSVLNAIHHYNIPVGYLQCGQPADFIIVDNLADLNVLQTYIKGEKVFDRSLVLSQPIYEVNKYNVFYKNELNISKLEVKTDMNPVRVIDVIDGELYTKSFAFTLPVVQNRIQSSLEHDIIKIINLNRYYVSDPVIGFIHNFGLKKGAIASTIAHDSHNIIAVGANDADLLIVLEEMQRLEGGVVVYDGTSLHSISLEIAGLITAGNPYVLSEQYRHLNSIIATMGCKLHAPLMTLSFMALLVIPELKIGDKGLFDGQTFSLVSLRSV